MNCTAKTTVENGRWDGQRGAALIMSLLVSTMILIAGGALILTTSMSAGLAIDSTAEAQAYYAAEAGLNSAENVLRGNIESSPTGTANTFRNAVTYPTLSRWLGYTATMNGTSVVPLSVSPALGYTVSISDPDNTPVADQPTRLLVRVTGYGPRASVKRMELVVHRYIFDFTPIATVLVRGNGDNTTTIPQFGIGNSNAKEYSGYDHANPANSIPVFGTTNTNDYNSVSTEILSAKPLTVSGTDRVKQFNNGELPSFLQTADAARTFLNTMQSTAVTNSRYFTTTPTDFGTSTNPKLTFVDGDCTLGDGYGMLIVTGKLTGNGAVGFRGLILVLGEGYFQRNGAGNGDTYGAIVVAKFSRTTSGDFLSPTYDMNGGGNSTTGYDSSEVDKALSAVGLRALAVREY
jgi:hypothetical protein